MLLLFLVIINLLNINAVLWTTQNECAVEVDDQCIFSEKWSEDACNAAIAGDFCDGKNCYCVEATYQTRNCFGISSDSMDADLCAAACSGSFTKMMLARYKSI